jgi:hypothetical protein
VSQHDRVLFLLRRGWVCGTEFLDERIPRYGARLFSLRRKGFVIVRRPCANPTHRHQSRQDEWRLIAEPTREGQMHAVFEGVSR